MTPLRDSTDWIESVSIPINSRLFQATVPVEVMLHRLKMIKLQVHKNM